MRDRVVAAAPALSDAHITPSIVVRRAVVARQPDEELALIRVQRAHRAGGLAQDVNLADAVDLGNVESATGPRTSSRP